MVKRGINRSQKLFLILLAVTVSYLAGSFAFRSYANSDRGIAQGYKVIYIVPHTHFDPYWLDPWQTEAERWSTNFRNALELMRSNPAMCFVIDQVVAIKYFWENYPEYHDLIKLLIQDGRLEVVQGFISQPEMNLVGEEGLIQDALLGIKWAREVLDANITTGWEIDVFGFGVGTPTFYKNLGLNFVVITRAGRTMNDGLFRWTGADNSTIYGYKLPDYSQDYGAMGLVTALEPARVDEFFQEIHRWIDPTTPPFQHTINPRNLADDKGDVLILYGSDFANPSLELPTYVEAWNAIEADRTGYVCKIATPHEFFSKLEPLIQQGGIITESISGQEDLNPVFPGYYTSHALFKQYIRYYEDQLLSFETFAAIAKQIFENFTYPEDGLYRIWYKNCVSHHHDSITGTSTQDVYEDNMQLFYQELGTIQALRETIFGELCEHINITYADLTVHPLVVLNPLSWNRTDVVMQNLTLAEGGIQDVEVIDPDSEAILPSQVIPIENATPSTLKTFTLLFTPTVPSMGYKTYLVRPLSSHQTESPQQLNGTFTPLNGAFENRYYRVDYNQTGNNRLDIWDKTLNWSIFNQDVASWQLFTFADVGNVYGFNFQGLRANITASAPTIEVVETGPVRIHVKFCYQIGASSFNRSVFLYDALKRVDFADAMNFLPENSTTLAFRVAFDVDNPSYEYDGPFGSIVHNAQNTYYPALYYVNVENATVGASLVNYGIHGYKRVGDQLEGYLLRFLKRGLGKPLTGGGTNDCFDNGTFVFSYAITTFNQTDDASRIAQQRLGYEWNFHLQAYETSLHDGVLNDTHSFYQVDVPGAFLLGLRKDWGDNTWSMQVGNFLNETQSVNISSSLPFSHAVSTDFLLQPLGSAQVQGGQNYTLTLDQHAWTTVVFTNASRDVNGPEIGELRFPDLWNTMDITVMASVTDGEGSSILHVYLQYAFNETFENQTWTTIPMFLQSDGSYAVSIPLLALTERPCYFRVIAIDAYNNTGTSIATTVFRAAAFTPAEFIVTIPVMIFLVIVALWAFYQIARRRRTALPVTSQPASRYQDYLVLLIPAMAFGIWIATWAVLKGYFGDPPLLSLNPGDNYPARGVGFDWAQTLHNTIFDFFTIPFMIGCFILSTCMVVAIQLATRTRLRVKHLALAGAGVALSPLCGLFFLTLLCIVGGAPEPYYGQLLSYVGFVYSRLWDEIWHVVSWGAFPVFAGALAGFCGSELANWCLKNVLPGSWKAAISRISTRFAHLGARRKSPQKSEVLS